MVDLATSRYGGEVVWCNDEFFAEASNLISPAAPVWREGEFTDHGKWMDGWETRRRRAEGFDSCVLRLGLPGVVRSITIDTSFFTGNFPEAFSLDACGVAPDRLDDAEWVEVVAQTTLAGDARQVIEVSNPHRATHLRLNIYPDGGVARLRVDGDPIPAIDQVCPDQGLVDLALASVGGMGVEASDAHYSSPANLVSPTEPEGMWDGWETARRRGPGHDWAVVKLGLPGVVEAVDVDTRHFKGNSPGWVVLEVARGGGEWTQVSERVEVEAHSVNQVIVTPRVEADRVRLNIYPDGGVARLRVWGRPHRSAATTARMRYLNSLFPQAARSFFSTPCAASGWVEAMVSGGPYADPEAVLTAAHGAFDALDREDWLEAFAAHPRIGDTHGRQTAAGEQFSAGEQRGMTQAEDSVRHQLDEINRVYEERFGHTYIVRAAGRSPEEMLEIARLRLAGDAEAEMEESASEQSQISIRRLRRMLCMSEEEE